MRSEPFEFFKTLNLSKDELYEIINYQEKTVLPVLEKVDDLKEKSGELVKSEEFQEAIKILREIIELANSIQDDALVIEQKTLISELTEKFDNQQIISEIEEATNRVEKEYSQLMRSKKILVAHELVGNFIKKYESVYDLSSIPSTKELILKEDKKWKAEQEKIRNDLFRLEKDFTSSLEDLNISGAAEIYKNGLNLLANLIDEKTNKKWFNFEKKLLEAKNKVKFIKKFDVFNKDIVKLKETHLYKELKSNIKNLIKQVEILDLPEYRSKLEVLKSEADTAEEIYNKKLEEISKLEKLIKNNQKNKRFEENLRDCNKIIQLASSIGRTDLLEEYKKTLEHTKKQIQEIREFEEKQAKLKASLTNLESDFNLSLKRMEINEITKIGNQAEKYLLELEDNDIKNKWKGFKSKFLRAKQLLVNIESLSIKGIEALNQGSCPDSLEFFEQIIYQLQDYET
jgi:vacuolar-type H+-ATPase subunit I/STV1